MGKKRELSLEKRMCIIELKKTGMKNSAIAKKLSISDSVVSRIIKQHAETDSLDRKPHSGRPKKVTVHTTRRIKWCIEKDPSITSAQLQVELSPLRAVSARTVRRESVRLGYHSFHSLQKPLMTRGHLTKRLAFCKKTKDWTPEDWAKVMWSDESNFNLFQNMNDKVRRKRGSDPTSPHFTRPTVKHPPGVMVWGCMCTGGRGGLFFLDKNKRMYQTVYLEVLSNRLLPFVSIRDTGIFMQDGAPCHTAKTVKTWINGQNLELLDWPPNSLDINPIENLWCIMKARVATQRLTTISQLKEALTRIWVEEITPELCKNLVDSMPRRVAAILKNNGFPSKY